MDYSKYSEEDFITDERFIKWVKENDPEIEDFWISWLAVHPEKRRVVENAHKFIAELKFDEKEVSDAEVEEGLARLKSSIALTFLNVNGKKIKTSYFQYWRKIAAVFVFSILFAGLLFFIIQNNQTVTYQTAYGEVENITLPDGSTAILNANSTLRYSQNWNDQTHREVWLDGEAFFSVVHLSKDQKFFVNTADEYNIEVLGTEFNVFQRERGTRIVLNSGSIKLNILAPEPSGEAAEKVGQILMRPGELVEFKEAPANYRKKEVDPEIFNSWTNKKLIFDNTPVSEIAAVLEETFGFEVQIANASLSEKRVWGSIPTDDPKVFLEGLARSLEINITRENNIIILSAP